MNDKKAIQLTDKFFEGKTTLSEEQELYAYFLSSEVCPKLMPLRQMFLDMSQMQGMELVPGLEAAQNQQQSQTQQQSQKARVVSINAWQRWRRVAIAATVMAIVGITATLWMSRGNNDYEMMAYGQRLNNREAVMHEVERTLSNAKSGAPNVGAELKEAFGQFQ